MTIAHRDLALIFASVSLSASCIGQQHDHRCDPGPSRPPEERTVSVAMVQCVEDMAVATPPPTAQPEYDPRTCQVDCLKTCSDEGHNGMLGCSRDPAGNVICTTHFPQHNCGRSTAGAPRPAPSTWAGVFELEAISAVAFRRLSSELERLAAPADLIEGARRASAEEVRHAELARERAPDGATFAEPRVLDVGPRTLREIAIENAREGCVRETWGAYLGSAHADPSADPALEAFMRAVADDERGHAAWSWALDDWARTVMSAEDVAALDDAHASARDELVDALEPRRSVEARVLFARLHEAA